MHLDKKNKDIIGMVTFTVILVIPEWLHYEPLEGSLTVLMEINMHSKNGIVAMHVHVKRSVVCSHLFTSALMRSMILQFFGTQR